ncbi:WGR domain-containing protein [Pyxidicoccus fallax]|uniref:WGR domain-containing protein n=1 Tax=Pyxidicoccus fallax TaxID=394095 RepID=A0A848LVQ7_9BACT|nr:WGR domain-containing protein [Pyxidicoccus fallax]NMO21886.1 WGR domain-containing protein [Pyxidicoccus fallax]NPC83496.1 WGR domain-containing protein [Pyxidicoccus fallax]
MPRYEFKEGSSSKFWEITLSSNTFTTRWGRIGTNGQEKTQTFDTSAEAKKEYEKLVREKEKKGYELVGDGEGGDEGDGESGEAASNPELEAAILANPDDADAYLVYGDWLQSQGDPRGELIALQAAALKATGDEAANLKKQISKFLKSHKDALLGELADAEDEEELKVEWHLGFIRSARVGQKDYDSERDVPELVKELIAHPSAKFLRELTLGMASFDGENSYDDVVASLTAALSEQGGSKTLQSLFIGDFEYPDDTEISWTYVNDISPLYKLLPNLRSLRLRGGAVELGKVDLPELREFTVETGGLPLSAVKSIAAAKWPKLEKLEVWFGSDNYGAEGGVDDIQPILDGKGLPNLKSLGLCNSEFTDELCKVLPKAKVLPQLERLDLSRGTMSDEGARILAESAAAFAHLKALDLTENTLTDEGERLVAKLCPSVSAGNQREYDEDYRYAAVGE